MNVLLFLPLVFAQVETPPGARLRLDELIESSNKLEHFRAEYVVEGSDTLRRLWIDYVAPRSIKLRMESSEGQMVWGIDGPLVWMDRSGSGGNSSHARVDLLDRDGACEEAIAVINESGWNSVEGPEVEFTWAWKFDAVRQKNDFSISVATSLASAHDHPRLLGWLHTIEHLEGDLSLEDGFLVHRSERAEARVDGNSGILESLVLTSAEGAKVKYRLEAVELDTPAEAIVFSPPSPSHGSIDQSEELRNRWTSRLEVRRAALEHVHGLLEGGSRRLDQELHDDLERFFSVLYDKKLLGELDEWIKSASQDAITFSRWIREQIVAGRSHADLESATLERRGNLERTIDTFRKSLERVVPTEIPNYPESRHWKAIRELEDAVLLARFNHLIAKPVLDDFDARVDEATGR